MLSVAKVVSWQESEKEANATHFASKRTTPHHAPPPKEGLPKLEQRDVPNLQGQLNPQRVHGSQNLGGSRR